MTESVTSPNPTLRPPPRVSGGRPGVGHMAEFTANPTAFLMRARAECGELAEFDLQGQATVLMSGPEANEAFCRAPDEQLSQNEAYQLMTPIFGKGVIFDAPLDVKDQQLAIQTTALRHKNMRSYARVISGEVARFTDAWGDSGELEIVSSMMELTLYTSASCLLGTEFRNTMSAEFADLYHDLEKGVHQRAYVEPYADIPEFRRRDAARARLQEIVQDIVERRRATGQDYEDALGTFMTASYTDGSKLSLNELTGLIIATMFAGHHTSAGTASWVLLEMLRHPDLMRPVAEEVNALGGDMSHESMREIPLLEGFIREVLRLHPPLIALFRRVLIDLVYKDVVIARGKTVCMSPYVSHRIPEVFPDPLRFDPTRPEPENVFAYVAFGGGRHRCAGNAFAILQLKAIFGTLLRRFDFELVNAPETYVDDPQAMTLRPKSPALVRYRRKA